MKKIVYIILLISILISCENETDNQIKISQVLGNWEKANFKFIEVTCPDVDEDSFKKEAFYKFEESNDGNLLIRSCKSNSFSDCSENGTEIEFTKYIVDENFDKTDSIDSEYDCEIKTGGTNKWIFLNSNVIDVDIFITKKSEGTECNDLAKVYPSELDYRDGCVINNQYNVIKF